MKRIAFLFVALFFTALTLTSCLKTRVCECRSSINPFADQNYSIGPGSKSSAQAECENYQFDGRTTSSPDYTCTLQ
jgi:hypothetical protein